MKTPPIGMTEDNFCAIVDPRSPNPKTETRRLLALKGRTQEEVNEITSFCQDGDGNWIGHFGNTFGSLNELSEFTKTAYPQGCNKGIKSKYQIGDRCYLTEPTQIESDDTNIGLDHPEVQLSYFWHKPELAWRQITESDLNKILNRKSGINSKQIARFMLKSFARYWVEIVDVRIERLRDITEDAAIAEGINQKDGLYFDYMEKKFNTIDSVHSYFSEIAAIHKPTKDKIGGWDLVHSNPWVWVYKFKLVGEN